MKKTLIKLLFISAFVNITFNCQAQNYVDDSKCIWNFDNASCLNITCEGDCKIRVAQNFAICECTRCPNFVLDNNITINITGNISHDGIVDNLNSSMNLVLN